MADLKVQHIQQWLKDTYNFDIDVDGFTGNQTVGFLIKALQTELGLTADGSFGPGTISKFDETFPNGLNVETNPSAQNIKNIIYILRGGMYCRGINGGEIYTVDAYKFDTALSNDIIFMKELLGLENPTDLTRGIEMKAVLVTDSYTLVIDGDSKIRQIQQALNRGYLNALGSYLPTNGLYERKTNIAIKKAIQAQIGVTADGSWGDGTKAALPALSRGSTNRPMVYLLQYLLYLNGFDPNGFDGSFGNGATNAVKNFQSLMHLTVDGSVGPQTWFALAVCCGDTSRSANACDTCFEITTARAQALKNNGYEVVGRYLNGYIDANRVKALQPGELQRIFDAGLKAFFIYQESNRQLSDFTYEKGASAGAKASKKAQELRILHNSVIYFAVDMDILEDQIYDYIIPFFRGINDALDPNYRVGIYAPRLVCSKIAEYGLAVSSFVSDMSTGYACNIGQKIPSNWCYDQYKEISNFNNDFDIDKVTYNGAIPACSALEGIVSEGTENATTFGILEELYDLAETYCINNNKPNTVYNKNILVLQFFRDVEYNNNHWNPLLGDIDNNWIQYALSQMNMTSSDRYNIYIQVSNSLSIGLIHFSAVLEGLLAINFVENNNNEMVYAPATELSCATSDLVGWAGDLIQMTAQLAYGRDTVPSQSTIMSYIGETSPNGFGFGIEDFLQDIDAINIYKNLAINRIDQVFTNYYDRTYHTRYADMCDNLKDRYASFASSDYEFLYNLAYSYVNKSGNIITSLLSTAFNYLFADGSDYDESIWAAPVATAFATKLCNLM